MTVEFEPADVGTFGDLPGMIGPLAGDLLPASEPEEATTLETIGTRWSDPDALEKHNVAPIFDRREELSELAELLGTGSPEAVVLVGPSRVGKTSLIRHLAWTAARTKSGATPESSGERDLRDDAPRLDDREVWFADSARLTSLDSPYGGWREQCADALDAIESQDAVLYLGRLLEALDAGKSIESQYNLAQFLKPILDDRRVRLVAEATAPEWNEIEQRSPGFARNFQVLRLEAPPEREAREILGRAADRLADTYNVEVAEGAVDRAWRLQTRFATRGSPLGHAVDFVGRTLERASQAYRDELAVGDVVDHFCEETGLPADLLRDDRALELDEVRDRLGERVMGQPAAIERVADVIGVTKADLGARNRPLGVFFFVGPTGVGKTELAKALAALMFGDDERMIRLDMSEYSTPGAHNRLIGEDFSERSEAAGDLTGPVRRNPFSVVLLDEVETAHSGVFDLLLHVFGEARLTDASGRTTRFQNTIVVMTSNLGGGEPGTEVGFDAGISPEAWEQHFRRAAENYFRPEFLGRIDQFVPFRPLPRDVVVRVAERELSEIGDRIGPRRLDAAIQIDDAVAEWVADEGWDERYGARPIERVVEQSVAWTIADHLARDRPPDAGSLTVRVSIDRDAKPEGASPVAVDLVPGDCSDSGRARDRLSGFVRRLAAMRRDFQEYIGSSLFEMLQDRVASYDESSRDESFWDEAEAAAEQARRASEAREIVEPARELADEISALEDLAREAYHARSIDTADEIAEQVESYEERVESLFLTLLTATYAAPNRIVLAVIAEHPEHLWRDEVVELYDRLSDRRDWRMQIWQAIPPGERDRPIGTSDDFEREELWRTQRAPHGEIVLLEFQGRAARPYLMFEGGRHRRITEDETEEIEARVLPPDDSWPHPETLRRGAAVQTARTWNVVEEVIKLGDGSSAPLDPEDPWSELLPHLERRAWEAASWS
jgi:ATP-dependent Clp protease ATP-binding subunit ClpA